MIVCPFKDLKRYASVIPGLEEALEAIAGITSLEPATVPLSGGNKILVQQGTTKPCSQQKIETHREFLDIQYIVSGEETMGWAPLASLTPMGEFDTAKDVGFYTGSCDFVRIGAGNCYVVFPEDGHMPSVHLDEPHSYEKMVVKLKV